MKQNYSPTALARAAGIAAALLGAIAVHAQPTGTQWDCTLSGKGQQGIAFITFSDDGTFSGYELLSSSTLSAAELDDRGPYVDMGRNPSDTDTNRLAPHTNLFGFGPITGPWGYDLNGKVIGHFVQYIGRDEEGFARYTNAVSFSAKVVSGKRLTMVASTPNGKLTFSGVPYKGTPDLGGSWSGVKVSNRQSFLEFFKLTSVAVENPFGGIFDDLADYPGIYFTPEGQGAGYTTSGFAMVSSRKKIGFSFETTRWGDTNAVLRATYGSWSASKGGFKAVTKGYEQPQVSITFNATVAPAQE